MPKKASASGANGNGKTPKIVTTPDGKAGGLSLGSISLQGGGGGSQAVFLYGPPKVGKTTMAAEMEGAVFILTETGLGQNKAQAFPVIQSWENLHQAVDLLVESDHDFTSVVIDTIDHAERMCFEYTCHKHGKKSIEDFGYGKGYKYAGEEFEKLIQKLEALVSHKEVNVVLIGHSIVKAINDPSTSDTYDQFIPDLHKNIWGLLKDWVDGILFVHRRVFVNEETGKGADGGLVIETNGSAAWEAGNRWRVSDTVPVKDGNFAKLLESVVADRQQEITF